MLSAASLPAVPSSPKGAGQYFERLLAQPESVPVAFTYGGERHVGLGGLKVVKREFGPNGAVRRATLACKVDERLTATLEAAYCREYGEVEYTLWFSNTGTSPTKALSDVCAYEESVPGENPRLRGVRGDGSYHFAPYDDSIAAKEIHFKSTSGRPTHGVFPYFDFVHGGGGTLMAVGWAGTWEATFSWTNNATRISAKTSIDLNAALMPGERIRTGLVVMLPYEGRDADRATNLWRAWFLKYNLPRANAKGDPIKPFATCNFAFDTGLPNSDGSISERSTTWRRTLDKLTKERMLPNFKWLDAGWYSDPAGNTVPTDWWGTVGAWEVDRVKWPGGALRECSEECHARGLKTLAWFEPERVTNIGDLSKNYGYNERWGAQNGKVITNNLGDDDCLAWTLRRIVKMMDENGIDLYREDNNSDPAKQWPIFDRREEREFALPRAGVNENKCVQGHYKLWDKILEYCARSGKCTYLDSCAGGGGRLDIESMRRSLPFMRSDADRTTIPMRLSQSWGLCKWIPFHGSSNKESDSPFTVTKGRGADEFVSRASLLPIFKVSGAFSHQKELDFDLMRRNYAEWKSVNRLLLRDYYTLTPWRGPKCRNLWTAVAYDAPETGDSIVVAIRPVEAEEDSVTVALPFARKNARYTLVDADSGRSQTLGGAELSKAFTISLPSKRSSALIRIKRN